MPHRDRGSTYWIEESIKDKKFEYFYEIQCELGRGSSSVVYQCKEIGTNKLWAAKIIEKKGNRKMVASEIKVLLRLRHLNIIRLKEVFETEEDFYLILEHVSGGEMFDRIVNSGYYSEKNAAQAVREMLEALKYLHDNDVVHRDLKPENILYEDQSQDSKIKLADFGLARIIGHDQLMMNTVCGTPGYCAPEVLLGTNYGPEVDLWSVGVITFILLGGYEPFYDDSGDKGTFKKILKCDYCFDSRWWGDVSENAKDLIRRLLEPNQKKRLTAAQALVHPWIRGIAARNDHMEPTQERLKDFLARRKLKAATHAVNFANKIAMNIAAAFPTESEGTEEQTEEKVDEPEKGDEQENVEQQQIEA